MIANLDKAQCGRCRYWQPPSPEDDVDERPAECRRHAPAPDGRWPRVHEQEWCGEYVPLVAEPR